jgi:hypothetical protein
MQHERRRLRQDALAEAGTSDQLAGVFRRLLLPDLPANDVAAEDVEEQVEIVEETLDRTVGTGYRIGTDSR